MGKEERKRERDLNLSESNQASAPDVQFIRNTGESGIS